MQIWGLPVLCFLCFLLKKNFLLFFTFTLCFSSKAHFGVHFPFVFYRGLLKHKASTVPGPISLLSFTRAPSNIRDGEKGKNVAVFDSTGLDSTGLDSTRSN